MTAGGGAAGGGQASRMRLDVRCDAPCIILPVSGRARGALAAQLNALHLTNCFKRAGDHGTVSHRADPDCRKYCIFNAI